MRAWLIKVSEPLPVDGPDVRLFRMGLLAEASSRRGHEVLWWASAFDHHTKQHRFTSSRIIDVRPGYRIAVMQSPGYRYNASVRRLWDHYHVARQFQKMATSQPKPDVIVSALPTLELCRVAVRLGLQWNVPVVVDARDMWPDVLERAFPRWARMIARPLLAPYFHMAKDVFANAFAITAHSPGFVRWGLSYAGRKATALDRHFSFGYKVVTPPAEQLQDAESFWREQGIGGEDDQCVVCFLGSIGTHFDFHTVLEAARKLSDSHRHAVRFVLCGVGDRLREMRRASAELDNVVFPGWVGVAQKHVLLQKSHVAIAPFIESLDFENSVPNKIPEYLSAGLPILVSLRRGESVDLLDRHQCGVSYQSSADKLVALLRRIESDREERVQMKKNALRLFHARFEADSVYGSMVDYLEEIVAAYPHRGAEVPNGAR